MPSPVKPEPVRGEPAGLPLSALLSQVLVAFTIEFDNEFERQMPHRTTNHPSTAGSLYGPWLVSLVMWSNCMRFVSDDGITAGELERLARTKTNLNGMERWGYVVVKPDPAGSRAKPPRSQWVIRPTAKGRQARETWRPLFGAIEQRWQERFGEDEIRHLREALCALVSQFEVELPDCLPILHYGLLNAPPGGGPPTPAARQESVDTLTLAALLSRALLAFAIEFERENDLSLAICANVVRVLDENGVRVSDLPRLSGVSKEAISMALGILQKKRAAAVKPDPAASRLKLACLTPQGRAAQDRYRQLVAIIEQRWQTRFGKDTVRGLRERLEPLSGGSAADPSPLFRGLEPYPVGWRASVPRPGTLPHYPMVLHRGGFPDGS